MKKFEALPVQQLLPGMRVASTLADEHGMVLLPAGAELSETTIASLQRRGVEEVSVELEVEDDPADLERYRQHVTDQMDKLFRHAGQGAETRALYQTIVKYRMENRS